MGFFTPTSVNKSRSRISPTLEEEARPQPDLSRRSSLARRESTTRRDSTDIIRAHAPAAPAKPPKKKRGWFGCVGRWAAHKRR